MAEQHVRRVVARLACLAAVAAGLAGAGCTYTTTTNTTGPGTLTVRMPGTLPAVASPPQGPITPPPSGIFAGVGTLSSSPGGRCSWEIPINHFVVTGNRIRYQGFRGTIQPPDTFLQMQAGNRFIYGYFDGGRFVGHYWQPHPECTYDLVLTHAG